METQNGSMSYLVVNLTIYGVWHIFWILGSGLTQNYSKLVTTVTSPDGLWTATLRPRVSHFDQRRVVVLFKPDVGLEGVVRPTDHLRLRPCTDWTGTSCRGRIRASGPSSVASLPDKVTTRPFLYTVYVHNILSLSAVTHSRPACAYSIHIGLMHKKYIPPITALKYIHSSVVLRLHFSGARVLIMRSSI